MWPLTLLVIAQVLSLEEKVQDKLSLIELMRVLFLADNNKCDRDSRCFLNRANLRKVVSFDKMDGKNHLTRNSNVVTAVITSQITFNELLNSIEEGDKYYGTQTIFISRPEEKSDTVSDEDSDNSDGEATGNPIHLPRVILRSHVVLPEELDDRIEPQPTTHTEPESSTPNQVHLEAQVAGCFVAEGIITYDTTVPSDYTNEFQSREDPNDSWKSILRSAMFRTLIKYTGFSPSLDVKMEADTILWEKLNSAKYTRKVPKPDEDSETLRTGALIDLSRENGYLEFRQVDKSLYTLEPKDHRLLALWRIRLIQSNHYIIQIKIPEDPPIEHFYEYSQTGGLKETRLKNVDYNKNKQNKNGSWKVRQRKAYTPQADVHSNVNTYSKRPDHYVVRTHQYNGNRYKSPQQTYRNGKAPRTYLFKPTTQYYTVVGIQTPPPVQKYPTWNDYTYQPTFPTNQVKEYTEFKQDSEYDGFLPSLGPGSNPTVYQPSANEAVPMQTFKQTTTYFPTYTPEPSPPTQSPYPLTYFKPSTQFVQYSEIDPFYSAQNDSYNSYGVINTAAAGLSLLGQYPLYYNSVPPASISVQAPPVEAGKSLYDLAINTLRSNSTPGNPIYTENAAQPTVTSFTVNFSPETEIFRKPEYTTESAQQTTIEILKPTITEVSQSKTRVKNSLRNPTRTSNSGRENYEYAPLYVQWGEKIKPSDKTKPTTPKIKITERPTTVRTTTSRTEKPLDKKTIKNGTAVESNLPTPKNISETIYKNRNASVAIKPSERLQELQKRRLSLKNQKQQKPKEEEILNNKQETVKKTINSTKSNETFITFENGTNFIITNIAKKSPEEVVRDYTTMGLQNSTSAENSENLRSVNAKNNAKETKNKEIDNENEGSEPVSVVVNRISQSYSYKTAEGESGNLRQLVET